MKVSAAKPVAAVGTSRQVKIPERLGASIAHADSVSPDDSVTISPAGRAAARRGGSDMEHEADDN